MSTCMTKIDKETDTNSVRFTSQVVAKNESKCYKYLFCILCIIRHFPYFIYRCIMMLLGCILTCDHCTYIIYPFEKRYTTLEKDSVGKEFRYDICCKCSKKNIIISGKPILQYYNDIVSTALNRQVKMVLTRTVYMWPIPIVSLIKVLYFCIKIISLQNKTGIYLITQELLMITIKRIHIKLINNEELTENENKIYKFINNKNYYIRENFSSEEDQITGVAV